jgi:hypothetical protein
MAIPPDWNLADPDVGKPADNELLPLLCWRFLDIHDHRTVTVPGAAKEAEKA